MSALQRFDQVGSKEALPSRPKLEVVKQPESLDQQIEKLAKKQRAIEKNLGQLRQVLGAYVLDELLDLADQKEEAEQKALLEEDIAAANTEWEEIGKELAELVDRKQLSSAWDEEGTGVVRLVDRSQEIVIPKEELQKRLPEKKQELEAAQRELEMITDQVQQDRKALERKAALLEQDYSSLSEQADRFARSSVAYKSPLLPPNMLNGELASAQGAPLFVKRLKKESTAIEAEIAAGPPKRGLFKALKAYFNAEPTWEERVNTLRKRDDEIDEAVREYAATARSAKETQKDYQTKLQGLEKQRVDLETSANPDYTRYAARYAQQEALAKKVSDLYTMVHEITEASEEE